MPQKVSRAEMKLGAFEPGKVDFYLIRTVSKRIVDGEVLYTSETSMGKLTWAGCDDSISDSDKFVLGMALENKKMIVPFNVQLFKGV